ncbi:MAG: trehalose-6-phosphate synthase [Haloarculaceae archaeon]
MQEQRTHSTATGRDAASRAAADWQLIVVSNRQPYRHEATGDGVAVDRPTGGLTAGLDPAMQQLGGTWIAWGDGDADERVVDEADCVEVPPDDPSYTLRRVWLSEDAVDDYYYGFSNRVLWPLSHSLLSHVSYEDDFWQTYRDVNRTFASAVADQVGDRPVVWFQDYHLALAPSMVRDALPDGARVQQFWHIPWPAWDIFRNCPHATDLLTGLLGNDLLGFHVPRFCRHFLRCVEAGLDDAVVDWDDNRVHYRGRTTHVEAVPMGIPTDEIEDLATSGEARAFPVTFRREHDVDADTRLAVGVDRLDYTKGIPQRLDALERLWATEPRWRGELTYVQNASVSRSKIDAYQRIQERVTDRVAEINDRFGTEDWQPIVFTTETLSRASARNR